MQSAPRPTESSSGLLDEMQTRAAEKTPVQRRGRLITFEGLDGSGKTTQLARLADTLRQRGLPVTTLRQPGGTAFGDRLRAMLVDPATTAGIAPLAPRTELCLMFADRAQAINEVIEPALAAGHLVLCDRFTDSTEAYQGGGRELGSPLILSLHELLCDNLQPDLTVLLLPPIASALRRARRRNTEQVQQTGVEEGRFEREPDTFYHRVHAAYERIAEREPARVVPIRDDAPLDAIEAHVTTVVDRFLASLLLEV